MLLEKIEGLLKEVSTVTAQSAEDVERLRLKYLSKKGEINALMGEFRNVAADQKRAVGIKYCCLYLHIFPLVHCKFLYNYPILLYHDIPLMSIYMVEISQLGY